MEDFLVEFLKEFSGTFWWFPRRIHEGILETSGITESNFRWFFRGIPQRKIYEYTHMCSKKLNIHDILSFQERFPRRFQDKKSGKNVAVYDGIFWSIYERICWRKISVKFLEECPDLFAEETSIKLLREKLEKNSKYLRSF